jgi:DivIVA domain-containing protein
VQFREKLRGYAPDEVDAALEEIASRLERGGRLVRADLRSLEFGHRWRGYHTDDVDAFIQQLLEQAL